jgi:hypothetical protein
MQSRLFEPQQVTGIVLAFFAHQGILLAQRSVRERTIEGAVKMYS